MGLGNAIGNFLIGKTDPNSDGLAVSTGIGEGQAQVLKPYSGEAWRQATQMNLQREAADRKRKDEETQNKSDLLKQFGTIGTYRPQEFDNVNYRQKKLQEKILKLNSSAPDYPQQLADVNNEWNNLKEITAISRDVDKTVKDLHEDITSGTKYYTPEQIAKAKALADEKYSVIDDDKAYIDKISAISGGLSSIYSNEGLIKDWTKHEKELAGAATMGLPETKTYTNKYGQLITETTQYTDPKALEESATRRFESSPQIQANYGTLDNYLKAVNNQATFKARVSNKFPPTSSANKGWSNSNGRVSNGKLAISEPINVRALNSVSREEAWKKYAEATKGNKKAKDHDTFMAEYVAKDTPVMLYPLKSLKAGGDNPEMDFIGGSGNKVRGKMLGQTQDGTMIGVKDKNGVITLVPSDLNQAFFNTHDTNSQEITEQTTNFKGADTKMIGDKGKVVEVKAEKGGKKIEKTVLKKYQNKNTNQTKFVYSDGTEEIVNGLK